MTHLYQKRPVEAAHFKLKRDDGADNGRVIASWCGGTYHEAAPPWHPARIEIDGQLEDAVLGDYVIKGADTFYSVHSDVFEQTYELQDDDPSMFFDWLSSTRELQTQSFGGDPADLDGEARAEFVRWNVLAATDELHEALQEVAWKPWGKNHGDINREAFIKECVDALHFVGNLLATVACTDEEFSSAYRAKQQVNRDRMASGTYTGTAEKCPHCKRDLKEAGVVYGSPHADVSSKFCGSCDGGLGVKRLDRSF